MRLPPIPVTFSLLVLISSEVRGCITLDDLFALCTLVTIRPNTQLADHKTIEKNSGFDDRILAYLLRNLLLVH